MKFHIFFLSFLLGISPAFSQQPAYFFLGEKEFEGVQIYDVIQDNNLNYWFATDHGFYKYNSYSFEKTDCSEMKGLSAFGFVKNQNGVIFCYNLNNQIIKIEKNNCSVFYELNENERSNDIYLSITSDNQLLVLTKTAIILNAHGEKLAIRSPALSYYGFPFKISDGTTISHMLGTDSLLIIHNNKFSVVQILHNLIEINGALKFYKIGKLTYAISSAGKQTYSFDENSLQLTALSETPLFQSKEFLRYYNENNQLWIAATTSGVRLVNDIADNQISEILYPEYLISDIYKDSEGNMLFSTFNNGVIVVPNLEIPDVLPSLEKLSVVSIQQDEDFGMLMGTLHGQLISFQNKEYKILSSSGTRPLQAIFSWPNFPYIIFDDGEIKAYNKKSGKTVVVLTGSLKDATLLDNHSIYLALNIGVCKITTAGIDNFKKEFFDSLKIRSYSIENTSTTNCIYVATSDGLKIIKSNILIIQPTFNNKTIFSNDIASYSNLVYVATKNKEILIFENDVVTHKIAPKLNQNYFEVHKLVVKENKIYTLSSEGFVVFDILGNVLMQLNKVQGFSTNKIFDFEIIDDEIWISHSKGVQKLFIEQLEKKIEKPILHITKIEVNDKLISEFLIHPKFESNQRKFRFSVSSPTLRNKENIKYHYKLIGYEENWGVGNYSENVIVYNALAPGNYTFVIKAENRGKYSELSAYSFSILSPLYLRWWFFLGIGIIIILLITLIYKYKLNSQRKKSEMINELNASKLTAIKSQMNPHFIFNALNSIQDLVLKGDVDNSYTFITKFSNLVRRTLNYSDKDFVDFDQEIKLLELYLSLEKLRFKKDLDFKIIVDNNADIMIPPLLIQPFVENALVHGLLHKEGNKKLLIHFRMEESLICIVEDNGVGREKAKAIKIRQRSEHESFSSKAILKRFEILSNVMNSKFGYVYEDLYENHIPSGTKVILTIPVKHKF